MTVLALFLLFVAACSAQDFGCDAWSYEEEDSWADVDCHGGNSCDASDQGPVTITSVKEESTMNKLRLYDFEDGRFKLTLDNGIWYDYSSPGATFRNYNSGAGAMTPWGIVAHIPPENVLPGHDEDAPAMEVQFNFNNSDGEWAVMSLFYWEGNNTGGFLKFLDPANIDTDGTTRIRGVQEFLDNLQGDYLYTTSSLTYPPCTTSVHYHFMNQKFWVTAEQVEALASYLPRSIEDGGNARSNPREVADVDFFNATEENDAKCGDGPWEGHPYDCRDQYGGNHCFFCSGRSHGEPAKYQCFNRQGRVCQEIFGTPEAKSFCNLEFECPASTLSTCFLVTLLVALFRSFF